MRPSLEDAIALAAEAHRGQVDRVGQPYVLHPLRVMLRLDSEEARIVGVLHDVIEDTPLTLDRLREAGYPEEVLRALDSVTRRDGERYEDYVERAAADPIGRQVKLADLEDNMDPRRLATPPHPTPEESARHAKYRAARERIAGLSQPDSKT